MIRYFRILFLRLRAGVLEAEIEHGEGLLEDHKRRLFNCKSELRQIKAREAMITPSATLLEQALRRK